MNKYELSINGRVVHEFTDDAGKAEQRIRASQAAIERDLSTYPELRQKFENVRAVSE